MARIKDDLVKLIDADVILQACEQAKHPWRDRCLNPVVTVQLLILQVLHGNTAISHLRHLAGVTMTASAYCQARLRLPVAVLERLCASVTAVLAERAGDVGRWYGHRVFHIDGSSFSMPDTPPLQRRFGQPGGQRPGCGFPVARLIALLDAGSGLIRDVLAAPLRTHDLSQAWALHPKLQAGDVLVTDRGFCSYAHLCLCLQQQLHAVFRAHQRTVVSFRPGRRSRMQYTKHPRQGKPTSSYLKRLGKYDQRVQYIKPKSRPTWMSQAAFDALPTSIVVRELRYVVSARARTHQITIVTTLLDSDRCPKHELARLYQQRWQVEVNLRHLKTTMGMDVLKCKHVNGVMKELHAFALVYNLVRLIMLKTARQQNLDSPNRISFIDAWRWLRHAQDAVVLPALIVNPYRPNRMEPRVIKRRIKEYRLMKHPRHQLRKHLQTQSLTA